MHSEECHVGTTPLRLKGTKVIAGFIHVPTLKVMAASTLAVQTGRNCPQTG